MAKKALCLSGGATRGSFQTGALKCLYEVYGFRPDVIAGTSVGAINGIKLACSPPPAVNDSAAILAAVATGTIDDQLKHMQSLEQFWLALNGRKEFFSVKPVFRGTLVEEELSDANKPPGMTLGTQIDLASAALFAPMLGIVALNLAGAIVGTVELQKIKYLIERVFAENAIADLTPVEVKLRNPANIVLGSAGDAPPYANNLFNGTPLYLAMVSLETGKLRYTTNLGEFYERDGTTPVATALLDRDVDIALDENLQPLAKTRKDTIKSLVKQYQAAVNQITAYHPELHHGNTPRERQHVLAALTERERDRATYCARALQQQIKGVTVKAVIRDSNGRQDPILAALASSSLPGLLDSPEVGVERYIDAGLREIIPVDIVLRHNVTQIIGILCSTLELPEADSMKNVGLLTVGARAATQIAINEITRGDMAEAVATGIDVRFIAPSVDVHSGLDLDPSLVELSMHYGWLRAADEMHAVTNPDERKLFRQASELIVLLRKRCLELERGVATNDYRIVLGQKWDYFALRVCRWAIMHLTTRRTALGLPVHPVQAAWATGWEREFVNKPPFQFPSVWSALEVRTLQGVLDVLWPASSPAGFNPDIGSLEDAGSGRVYWMRRGALFEDRSGVAPSALSDVLVPSSLHQFLPRVPTGTHLMAETQRRQPPSWSRAARSIRLRPRR